MSHIKFCTSSVISGAALGACTIGEIPGVLLGGTLALTSTVIILTKLPNSINKSLDNKGYNEAIQIAAVISQLSCICF